MSKSEQNSFDDKISNLKLSFDSNDSFSIECDEKFNEFGNFYKENSNIHTASTKDNDLVHIDYEMGISKVSINSAESETKAYDITFHIHFTLFDYS